jgi:two-component system, OmpR family, sensor histidine kinase KdpD
MPSELRRRTPEELLRAVQAEEEAAVPRGRLKIFLGYASGVGKSFRMLDEARRRKARGEDVVVGGFQRAVPEDVAALLRNIEVIAPIAAGDRAAINLEAILRRHPAVCVIDGLAYDNPPGSRHATRWEDVRELLKAGISVITSVNIQYIAEVREQVEAISGKHVCETVPVEFIKSADEIELVDAPPPEEPLEWAPEARLDAERRQQRLSKLRELTLVLAAEVVDQELTTYLESHGIAQHYGTQERLLVCITPRANIRAMVDTARIMADRFHGELIVAYVQQAQISEADQAALDGKLEIARAARAQIEILDGEDPIETILDFARSRHITQLFIGHTQRSGVGTRLWGDPVDKLIRGSRGMDVRIFPQ